MITEPAWTQAKIEIRLGIHPEKDGRYLREIEYSMHLNKSFPYRLSLDGGRLAFALSLVDDYDLPKFEIEGVYTPYEIRLFT